MVAFTRALFRSKNLSFPDSYWPHLEFSLRRCERIRQGLRANEPTRPELAAPDPFGAVQGPAPVTVEARKETG